MKFDFHLAKCNHHLTHLGQNTEIRCDVSSKLILIACLNIYVATACSAHHFCDLIS